MKKYAFFLLLIAAGCSNQHKLAGTQAAPQDNAIADGKLFTSLFQQRAAEYRALCLQAYNIARVRLDAQLSTQGRPKAIITDLDETALDNSPYAVHRGLEGRDWDQVSWYNWTSLSEADTIAGSLSFFRYAASKGVTVFYITNRDETERRGTLENLRRFNFPYADDAHLLLKKDSSSKESRRMKVMADYDVVLLLGDNLADFSRLFDHKTEAERKANVDALTTSFGDRFIILPNANYGDWEGAFYQYKHYTPAQKDSVIRASLRSYEAPFKIVPGN